MDDDPIQQFKSWYLSKPIVTRSYMTFSFLLSIVTYFKFVDELDLYYAPEITFMQFQLWRPITALLYQGKFSLSIFFSMFFIHFALNQNEAHIFKKKHFADFLWLVLSLFSILVLISSFYNLYFFGDAFLFALIYIACKKHPFQQISFLFGIKVKSGIFPWVYIGIQVLSGHSFVQYIIGLILGHIYVFIKFIMFPRDQIDYYPTPQFFKRLVQRENKRQQGQNIEENHQN